MRMPDLHIPAWVAATHFLNLLFLTLLARSGVEVLSALPKLYLSDHCPPGREVVRYHGRTWRDDLFQARSWRARLPHPS